MTARRRASRVTRAALAVSGVVLAVVMSAVGTGRIAVVSTYGVSMSPVYHQGDLVVVARADSYATGQIVAYPVPGDDVTALHRIVGGDGSGFVLQGDNNASVDPIEPSAADILGRAVLHVPRLGGWLDALTDPFVLAALAFVLVMVGSAPLRTRSARARRKQRTDMTRPSGHLRPVRSLAAMPRPLRAASGLAAATAALGLALGAVAWTTPTEGPSGAAVTSTQRMTFAYSATVPLSAAYDDTTVASPEPVFRRLTDAVDVHLAYEGTPGTLSVDAELSTPGGWRTSVPLTPTADSTAPYDTTVRLDLTEIQARSDAAAAVTGIEDGPVTITIAATVDTDGAPFASRLPLRLTPLQLTLADGPGSLVSATTTAVPDTTPVERSLGAAGVSVSVQHARLLALALLTAAAVTAGITLSAARRAAPVGPGAQIRRRYAPLIASVVPMAMPANARVIDVADFATLAKVAQRYGLLVMHWSRSDVDTFLVLDETAGYRYRCGADSHVPDAETPAAAEHAHVGEPA